MVEGEGVAGAGGGPVPRVGVPTVHAQVRVCGEGWVVVAEGRKCFQDAMGVFVSHLVFSSVTFCSVTFSSVTFSSVTPFVYVEKSSCSSPSRRYMPGYPSVSADNDYLFARHDGAILDAQPWGMGPSTPSTPGGPSSTTDPPDGRQDTPWPVLPSLKPAPSTDNTSAHNTSCTEHSTSSTKHETSIRETKGWSSFVNGRTQAQEAAMAHAQQRAQWTRLARVCEVCERGNNVLCVHVVLYICVACVSGSCCPLLDQFPHSPNTSCPHVYIHTCVHAHMYIHVHLSTCQHTGSSPPGPGSPDQPPRPRKHPQRPASSIYHAPLPRAAHMAQVPPQLHLCT